MAKFYACPDCGAECKGDLSKAEATCEGCKSTFSIRDEMPVKWTSPNYPSGYCGL